jgi:soluble lytic murein transglycosylase-like protein
MAATLQQTSTFSARLTSLLYGALMSAIVLASAPSLPHATRSTQGVVPTTVVADAVPTPAPPVVRPAGPDKRTMTAYLAREWKLGRTYAAQVASAVLTSAKRYRVDPMLLLAVAATESSLQHSVGNPGGGADPMKPYGIMQVAGQHHTDKFPGGVVKRTSVVENVDIGAKVLKEYLALEGGNERRALLRYNGSLNVSDKYFWKVNRFKQRLTRELHRYQHDGDDERPA